LENTGPLSIAIHGGSGAITRENLSGELEQQYRQALQQAVIQGFDVLQQGGSSIDAVCQSVRLLEDSPLFNAGRGSVFNHDGINELDAAIMDGRSLAAGAVTGVRRIAHPVELARLVMERSRHVMLSGEGAEEFALLHGMATVEQEHFFTERRWQELQAAIRLRASGSDPDIFGTVGAVARDCNGDLAAATSTGGMTDKQFGRIGDSPIIGAGTYADNESCAVSATGHGEYFIRVAAAHDICSRMRYGGFDLGQSAQQVIMLRLASMGGTGGVIGVDHAGKLVMLHNSPGMFRACARSSGEVTVAIFKDEGMYPQASGLGIHG